MQQGKNLESNLQLSDSSLAVESEEPQQSYWFVVVLKLSSDSVQPESLQDF